MGLRRTERVDIDPDHLIKDALHFRICVVVPLLLAQAMEVAPITATLSLDMLGHSSSTHREHRGVRIVFQLVLTQKSVQPIERHHELLPCWRQFEINA